VRCRIDLKYALGLDLDDPSFHYSLLGGFRDRLLEDGRAGRLLDLARLKEAGLVRERTAGHAPEGLAGATGAAATAARPGWARTHPGRRPG